MSDHHLVGLLFVIHGPEFEIVEMCVVAKLTAEQKEPDEQSGAFCPDLRYQCIVNDEFVRFCERKYHFKCNCASKLLYVIK